MLVRRPAAALPDVPPQDPRAPPDVSHLMISLSQPHNAASVLELSRSLEFEHEVRHEVTLQVMRWFGQIDDGDERWEMDGWCIKSAWVFCVNTRLVSASVFFPTSNLSLFDPNFVFG
jgi:hypothetical protein